MSAASTPVKLKMVTFKLPQDSPKPSAATPTEKATSLSSSQDAKLDAKLSSPVVNDPQVTKKDSFPSKIRETPKKHVIQVPSTSSQQSALQKPAPQTHTPQANPLRSPEPDLVADILNRPKSVHPKLLESMQLDRADSKPTSQQQQQQVEQKGSAINSRSKKAGFISSTRERPSVASKRKKEHLNPAKTAADIREQTNAASHNHTRSLKYDVGKLRESLLKVEEEIKHLNRGRHTLEMGIHDIRKALSVNQQSISNQQKKSRGTEVYIIVCNVHLHSDMSYTLQYMLALCTVNVLFHYVCVCRILVSSCCVRKPKFCRGQSARWSSTCRLSGAVCRNWTTSDARSSLRLPRTPGP